MTENVNEILVPVTLSPAGLISWYDSNGDSIALVASWVAMVGGKQPILKSSWYGSQDDASRFWQGGDFVYNVLSGDCLDKIKEITSTGRFCINAEYELGYTCHSGITAVAPRLCECLVQIECINGRLNESYGDVELNGDVTRLHRGQVVIDPFRIPDLCAIDPLA